MAGFTDLIFEPPEGLIDAAFQQVSGSVFFTHLTDFVVNKVMVPLLIAAGFLYLAKVIWEMTRGQENWDEVLVFLVKKSIPVLLLFVFVSPSPEIFEGGGKYPLGVELYLSGAKASFETVKNIYGVPFEVIPYKFAKEQLGEYGTVAERLYESWDNIQKRETTMQSNGDGTYTARLYDPKSDQVLVSEVYVTGSDTQGSQSGISNVKKIFFDPVGAFIKPVADFFMKVLMYFVRYLMGFFIDVAYVIVFLSLLLTYYILGLLILIKFVALAPVFFLSVLFVLIDRWKEIFWSNLRHYFALLLQPAFLVFGFGLSFFTTFLLMVWFLEKGITKLAGLLEYVGVIAGIILLIFTIKIMISFPTRLAGKIIDYAYGSVRSYFSTID